MSRSPLLAASTASWSVVWLMPESAFRTKQAAGGAAAEAWLAPSVKARAVATLAAMGRLVRRVRFADHRPVGADNYPPVLRLTAIIASRARESSVCTRLILLTTRRRRPAGSTAPSTWAPGGLYGPMCGSSCRTRSWRLPGDDERPRLHDPRG